MMEDMLFKTDSDYAPWTIIEATDRRFATVKIYTTVIKALADRIEAIQEEMGTKNGMKPAEMEDTRAADLAREADREMRRSPGVYSFEGRSFSEIYERRV